MRFPVFSLRVRRLAALSIGLCAACADDEPSSLRPSLEISVAPAAATVAQGDSSQLVALVSALVARSRN